MGKAQALPTLFCLICFAYGCAQLWATWFRPHLQRYWILKPGWSHGYRASRLGVTTQACSIISLGAMVASGLAKIDPRYALGALMVWGTAGFLMWGIDVSSDFNEKR